MAENLLRLHDRLALSIANGLGARAVIWLQGCPIGCRGCFNTQTFDQNGGETVSVDALFDWLVATDGIEGVSVSGGEPTEQIPALTAQPKIQFRQSTRSVASTAILFSC